MESWSPLCVIVDLPGRKYSIWCWNVHIKLLQEATIEYFGQDGHLFLTVHSVPICILYQAVTTLVNGIIRWLENYRKYFKLRLGNRESCSNLFTLYNVEITN